MDASAHIVVRGLVQGVGYRYFVQRNAAKLGLSGYTRNLYNGDVEVEVEGGRSLIDQLIGLLNVGPRSAQVSGVQVEWKDPTKLYSRFEIR
jgi:acylphosphatase